jgi:hypothetical protein
MITSTARRNLTKPGEKARTLTGKRRVWKRKPGEANRCNQKEWWWKDPSRWSPFSRHKAFPGTAGRRATKENKIEKEEKKTPASSGRMGGGEEGAEAGHKGAQGSLRLGKEGRKEMGRADDLNLLGIVRFQRLKLKGRPEGPGPTLGVLRWCAGELSLPHTRLGSGQGKHRNWGLLSRRTKKTSGTRPFGGASCAGSPPATLSSVTTALNSRHRATPAGTHPRGGRTRCTFNRDATK